MYYIILLVVIAILICGIYLLFKKRWVLGSLLIILDIVIIFIIFIVLSSVIVFLKGAGEFFDERRTYTYFVDDIISIDSLYHYSLFEDRSGGSDINWYITKSIYRQKDIPTKIIKEEFHNNIEWQILFEDFKDSGEPFYESPHLALVQNKYLVFIRGAVYRGLYNVIDEKIMVEPRTYGHITEDSVRFYNSISNFHNQIAAIVGKLIDGTTLVEKDSLWYEPNSDKPYSGEGILWDNNGQKLLDVTYKDGKMDGKLTYWYENGHKKIEGTHKDHRRVGKWTYYNENGTVKEVRDCDKVDCY